ncbi:MAG: penicillin acylase family protein [Chromatiaceae bacterium]|nr:penicillin acylase family protein [Chromatiaceae bacterium]
MVRRILLVSLAALFALCIAVAAYLVWAAKRSEPVYSGTVEAAGLNNPVKVRFGPHAVPTIEAETLQDLLFAQGFLTAAERMWQMDLMRRLATGRLAEVLGVEALATDRMFRTLGLGQAARESFSALRDSERDLLESYTAGVNAYRKHAANRLPVEYLIARFEPSPWAAEDSLAIGEYMSWLLSFNAREELIFMRMAAKLGPERARELFPTDEGILAPEPAAEVFASSDAPVERLGELLAMPAVWGLPVPGAASNAWAVNGKRTEDGVALLANDPHLAPSLPGLWYELEMLAPDYHVAGASLPGVPLVLIGHNDDLAWGFTTAMADTQDIFVERLTEDGGSVATPRGGTEQIQTRTEEINVRGKSDPIRIEIRSTAHGPIINDILGETTGTRMDFAQVGTKHLLALRTNLDVPERSIEAFYKLNTARSLSEGRAAIADLKHSAQNLMLAHRDGGIAWQISGAIPVRGEGHGAFPSPGWEPGYGWQGYYPSGQNPGITNPPGYALVTANNRTVPIDHPIHLTHSWMAPFRSERIEEMLNTRRYPLNAQDMARMQLDRISIQARRFKKALGSVAAQLRELDPKARKIADEYLMTWDGSFEPDSRPAALFALLQPALYEHLFGDELGEDLPLLMSIAIVSYNALEEALYTGRSSFWDDVRTPEREEAAHIWARALRSAKSELDNRLPELGRQRLDRIRYLYFPHAFDRIPLLGSLFGIGPIAVGGDTHTLNTMKTYPTDPGRGRFVPSMRVIFTPSDWSLTRGTLNLGQSGHRLSPYLADQLNDWLGGRLHTWPWNGPEPGSEIGMLVLNPTAVP